MNAIGAMPRWLGPSCVMANGSQWHRLHQRPHHRYLLPHLQVLSICSIISGKQTIVECNHSLMTCKHLLTCCRCILPTPGPHLFHHQVPRLNQLHTLAQPMLMELVQLGMIIIPVVAVVAVVVALLPFAMEGFSNVKL